MKTEVILYNPTSGAISTPNALDYFSFFAKKELHNFTVSNRIRLLRPFKLRNRSWGQPLLLAFLILEA